MISIEQRVAVLESIVNTTPTAVMNVALEILSTLNNCESVDKEDLKRRLEDLRDVTIENGNMKAYNELISLAVSRLS